MRRKVSVGWGAGFAGVTAILFGLTAGAQTVPVPAAVTSPPPATVSTNVQDFAQGFRTFIRMGLPDTSQAKYVKLDNFGGSPDMMMHRIYEIQLSGNAWLISEDKTGKSVLVTSVGRRMELLDQKTALKKQEAVVKSNAVAKVTSRPVFDFSQAGSWTPVDLSRDLAKATAFVEKKIKAKSAGGREMRYDSFLQSDESAGMLFMLAAFAWQNGKTQEANLLAGRLFTLVGDSRKVIVGALNVLADAQLAASADNFRKSGDWKAYAAEVSELLKKYPAGWRKAGAAKLLADRLQARAAMVQPPTITGEGLGEEDIKLADELVSATNQPGMQLWSGNLWILPQAKAMQGVKDDSAIGRIKARGVKSLPLLIALASDETLCPLRPNDIGFPTHTTTFNSNDTGTPEAERSQTYFKEMDRPLTRGEIARGLLAPLCQREENERHGGSDLAPEEIIESAKQVYTTLKALPPSGLASHFLKNGDQSQKQAAIGCMLQNDVETNASVIEAFLLTPPSEESGSRFSFGNGLAQQYVQKRGDKAAEFVEKYAAMRKKIELPTGMSSNEEYVKMMEKQTDQEIKSLRAIVKKQDLSETVADLAKSGDGEEWDMAAYTALGRLPPAQAMPALLSAAVKTTNVAVRAKMLQMIPMLRYSGMQDVIEEGGTDLGPEGVQAVMKKLAEKNKMNIVSNTAEWKILLADTRVMPGGSMYPGGAYEMTIADLAATGVETLYAADSPMERFGERGGAGNLNQDVMMKIIHSRAVARIAGKPEEQLPKFPSADEVTAERRKAIETEVLKASPETLGAVLDKLTDAETLYLVEATGENESLMKAMAPVSRRIATVKTVPALPAPEAARLQKLAGTMISTNVITEMRELCKRQLEAGTAYAITLSAGGIGKGLSLKVAPVEKSTQRMYGSGFMSMISGKGKKPKGMVMGMVMSGHTHGNGMWLVDLPASVAVSTNTVSEASAESDDRIDNQVESLERSFESQREQFESAVEAFCKPGEAIGPNSSVSFTGMIPSKEAGL